MIRDIDRLQTLGVILMVLGVMLGGFAGAVSAGQFVAQDGQAYSSTDQTSPGYIATGASGNITAQHDNAGSGYSVPSNGTITFNVTAGDGNINASSVTLNGASDLSATIKNGTVDVTDSGADTDGASETLNHINITVDLGDGTNETLDTTTQMNSVENFSVGPNNNAVEYLVYDPADAARVKNVTVDGAAATFNESAGELELNGSAGEAATIKVEWTRDLDANASYEQAYENIPASVLEHTVKFSTDGFSAPPNEVSMQQVTADSENVTFVDKKGNQNYTSFVFEADNASNITDVHTTAFNVTLESASGDAANETFIVQTGVDPDGGVKATGDTVNWDHASAGGGFDFGDRESVPLLIAVFGGLLIFVGGVLVFRGSNPVDGSQVNSSMAGLRHAEKAAKTYRAGMAPIKDLVAAGLIVVGLWHVLDPFLDLNGLSMGIIPVDFWVSLYGNVWLPVAIGGLVVLYGGYVHLAGTFTRKG